MLKNGMKGELYNIGMQKEININKLIEDISNLLEINVEVLSSNLLSTYFDWTDIQTGNIISIQLQCNCIPPDRTPNPTPPYGTPYYRTQNHTITNQITRTMPPPLIKIGSKYPDNTTNTPHEIKIPKGLEVPADTKPKAPTNYSIDEILKQKKEKKQNQGFYR